MAFLFLLLVMEFINVNGKIVKKDTASVRTDNHSYRYGDGLFETMKVAGGKILLSDLHFQRLFTGLSVLRLQPTKFLNPQNLQKQIIQLCKKNDCEALARVRLSFSGGSGGLYARA